MLRRGRPSKQIVLTAEERAELRRRVRAATATQRDARRARIILASADYAGAEVVARVCGVAQSTVVRWRARFIKHRLNGLNDCPRSGRPWRIGPVARMQVIAAGCRPAPVENGMSGWTLDRLAEVVHQEIDSSMSRSTVQRILESGDLKPHRIRGWVHSTDPLFKEKATEVCGLYLNPPPNSIVLSIDEKTGMQARERKHPDRPALPGRAARREFEYIRHGTQTLLAALNVHTGEVLERCGDTRTGEDLVQFMEHVANCYPTGDVHVIWDNLNIHFDGAAQRWTQFNERNGNRFHFHYTPLHASWVNQVELFFSIVEAKVLRHGSFDSEETLRNAVVTFIAYWNQTLRRPFRWTFTGYPLQIGEELKAA